MASSFMASTASPITYSNPEEEITQFEAHWPIGTKQRLAFALLLFTGQRGSDVCRMTWPDATGRLRVVQQKTGARLVITVHRDLKAVLDTARTDHVTILTTAYDKPFTEEELASEIKRLFG